MNHEPCKIDGDLSHEYTDERGTQGWYCLRHQQWTYVVPIETVYHYEDGTEFKRSER